MDDSQTSIDILNLPSIYRNGLLRLGIETVEELEDYLQNDEAGPLSSHITHFGVKGDFMVADALEFYHSGKHLEQPKNLLPVKLKDEHEIEIVDMYRKLDTKKKNEVLRYMQTLLEE